MLYKFLRFPNILLSLQLILFRVIGLAQSGHKCEYIDVSSTSRKFHDKESLRFCVRGHDDTTIWAIWADVEFRVRTSPGISVNVVRETSCETLVVKCASQSTPLVCRMFHFLPFCSSRNNEGNMTLSVSPYGTNCLAISIDSYDQLDVKVVIHKLNLRYLILLILGVFLFYRADAIARSILFYYTAGVSVGMILAVFLLLFVISKFIPQRGVGYAFMFCGSSIVLYFFQVVKDHIVNGDFTNSKIFYFYFLLAGIISFLYCYYRGPVQSERGLDIMRWCLQSVALCMIYYSIRCEKISLTLVLLLMATKWISFQEVVHYILTRGWIPYRLQAYFRGPRFIKMGEYEKEGREETARALKELREYCESPDFNAWKTVSRLQDPKRFASFMSYGGDVTPEERQVYDETSFDFAPFLTSDEDSEVELAMGEL